MKKSISLFMLLFVSVMIFAAEQVGFNAQTAIVGKQLTVTVSGTGAFTQTSDVTVVENHAYSYQFKFAYDTTYLKYDTYSTENTFSTGGTVVVNKNTPGVLTIGFMSTNLFYRSGNIINLKFTSRKVGSTIPSIFNFIYDDIPVINIKNSIIKILKYGDVDGNDKIQAFDASLVLRNSVGIDPLPTVDPLPWEEWRFFAGDVDGNKDISAYDAALILQKAVDLIPSFPIENTANVPAKSPASTTADVIVELIDNYFAFKSIGDLLGLNIEVVGDISVLGRPEVVNTSMLSEINIGTGTYNVALATAIPPEEGDLLLRIPVVNFNPASIEIKLKMNSLVKSITFNLNQVVIPPVDSSAIKVNQAVDLIYKTGKTYDFPIYIDSIPESFRFTAYQFDFKYDHTKLEYSSFVSDSTLSSPGQVMLNNLGDGVLRIGYMSSVFTYGKGDLLKLKFKAIVDGSVQTEISNCFINNLELKNVPNGTVNIYSQYGDVDVDDKVLAYDAGLVLQYSVSLNPLPVLDPLPWENWRIEVGDVDNDGSLTSNDAGLILQKSISIIDAFPVEPSKGSNNLSIPMAELVDVQIVKEWENLYVKSYGNLIGLNIEVSENIQTLGAPVIPENGFIKAVNITDSVFLVGLAIAQPVADGTTLMSIPLKASDVSEVVFKLKINAQTKEVRANVQTAITNSHIPEFAIFPNPASDYITITDLQGENLAYKIFNSVGQNIVSDLLNSDGKIDVQDLKEGVYLIYLKNDKVNLSKRFIKK